MGRGNWDSRGSKWEKLIFDSIESMFKKNLVFGWLMSEETGQEYP